VTPFLYHIENENEKMVNENGVNSEKGQHKVVKSSHAKKFFTPIIYLKRKRKILLNLQKIGLLKFKKRAPRFHPPKD